MNVRWNRKKTTTKNSGEKYDYVQGVEWVTIEVDRRENSGISAILHNVTSIWNEDNKKSGKIAGLFYFLPNE